MRVVMSSALLLLVFALGTNSLVVKRESVTIIQGNDDGWGAAYIRALYQTLQDSGYTTAISAPANNKSGTGSLDATPQPLQEESDYGLLPAGAPATGSDPQDKYITYVNSYPVTGVKFGISTVAPALFGGPPGIVLTGINHGNNIGVSTLFSGTVGAANEAVSKGIPALAFSAPGDQRSFQTLKDGDVSYTYANVAVKLLDALLLSGTPYLPSGIGLNINFNNGTACTPESYTFHLSRIYFNLNPFGHDLQHCGTNHLPTESSIMSGGSCRVSISGFQKNTKLDIGVADQEVVRDKLANILSCV